MVQMFLDSPLHRFVSSPLTTNFALYLSRDPSDVHFTVNTHLQPIALLFCSSSMIPHVLAILSASISTLVASLHFLFDKTSDKVLVIGMTFKFAKKLLWDEENI